jgi:hypothetical protein
MYEEDRYISEVTGRSSCVGGNSGGGDAATEGGAQDGGSAAAAWLWGLYREMVRHGRGDAGVRRWFKGHAGPATHCRATFEPTSGPGWPVQLLCVCVKHARASATTRNSPCQRTSSRDTLFAYFRGREKGADLTVGAHLPCFLPRARFIWRTTHGAAAMRHAPCAHDTSCAILWRMCIARRMAYAAWRMPHSGGGPHGCSFTCMFRHVCSSQAHCS